MESSMDERISVDYKEGFHNWNYRAYLSDSSRLGVNQLFFRALIRKMFRLLTTKPHCLVRLCSALNILGIRLPPGLGRY